MVLVPVLVLHTSYEPTPPRHNAYAATDLGEEIRELRDADPDLLFLGNSMLFTRIDVPTLESVSGLKCRLLTSPGAASAVWYLHLKNIVAPSGVKPQRVVIFFRDRFLTWPQFKTRGIHEAYFKSVQRVFGEPEVDAILGEAARRQFGIRKHLLEGIGSLYPTEGTDDRARRKLDDLAMDISALGGRKRQRRAHMRDRFALANLRDDIGLDFEDADEASASGKIDYGWPDSAFSADPHRSFLPHMIEVANRAGVRLCFYRVKRRPKNADGTRPPDPALDAYIEDLRHWIEKNGHMVLDESADPAIPLEAYADGDHIAPEKMAWYTRKFWERFEPHL